MKLSAIFSILFSTLMLMQSASLLLFDAGFNLNRSYIASTLCENRNNPKSHCDGKCFLKKGLSKQLEKNAVPGQDNHQNISFPIFCEDFASYLFFPARATTIGLNHIRHFSKGHTPGSEHPPAC